jgi:hypothetical protein
MKPFWNISELERMIHEGLADCWHRREWFKFLDDDMQDFMVGCDIEPLEVQKPANWYGLASPGAVPARYGRISSTQYCRLGQRIDGDELRIFASSYARLVS